MEGSEIVKTLFRGGSEIVRHFKVGGLKLQDTLFEVFDLTITLIYHYFLTELDTFFINVTHFLLSKWCFDCKAVLLGDPACISCLKTSQFHTFLLVSTCFLVKRIWKIINTTFLRQSLAEGKT